MNSQILKFDFATPPPASGTGEGPRTPNNTEQTDYSFSDQRLLQHFGVAIGNSDTIEQLHSNISQILKRQTDCLSVWAIQKNEQGEFELPQLLSSPEDDPLWPVVEEQVRAMISRVSRTNHICSSPVQTSLHTTLVVSPISKQINKKSDTQIDGVLIGCFAAQTESVLRLQWLAGIASEAIGRWHQKQNLNTEENKSRYLRDSIGLIHSLDQTQSVSEAIVILANHLRRLCDAEQVAICLAEGRNAVSLKAISDVEQIDLNAESNKTILHACQQTAQQNVEACFPDKEKTGSIEQLSLQKYCKSNGAEACICIPLITGDDRKLGVVLLACPREKLENNHYRTYCSKLVQMTSSHVDVVIRANRGAKDIISAGLNKLTSSNRTHALLLAISIFIAVLLIPLTYRVNCECELQPVFRRFVAAPHDGILEKTLVKSGDTIAVDQVIALLDGRKLRIELSGIRANYDGAKKRRESALALGNIAESQIASSEMNRFQSKIEILEQQLTQLEVRSPIHGLVLNGDLEKAEGAPLEMGQTLFEIAPLTEMVAEISIPESEIQYVKSGMPVTFKLNAFPLETWSGKIEHIHPCTEIVDTQSVFVARVRLPNAHNQFRPGMQGSAKIKTKKATLGWNLFHQGWESLRYWTIW
tara:strand:+ start:1273 stop:3201 length:1929 start_codon:yes stop_codon:yes gene_type:complete